jgi:hypothetical protein
VGVIETGETLARRHGRAARALLAVVVAMGAAAAAAALSGAGHADTGRRIVPVDGLRAGVAAPSAFRASTAAWCGSAATEDRPPLVTGKAVHVVYAYPTDAPDRFGEVAARIHGDLQLLDTWWRGQDPTRSLRFDLTSYPCGPQLDVTVARLPEAASAYYPLQTRYEKVSAALGAAGLSEPWAKYLVYVDGPAEGRVCGQGGGAPDYGPSYALVYLLGPCSQLETVAAHEVIHSLGVARYATGAGHLCPDDPAHVCDSEQDMMYPYANDLFTRVLDAGRDDYYAHGGSWYDLQDSPWLRRQTQARISLTVRGSGTVTSGDPGIDCSASCETDWDAGIPVTLDAEAADGMRLIRWEGACTGDSSLCELPMTGPVAVTAFFAPQTFPLTLSVGGRGTVTSPFLAGACRTRCRLDATSYEPIRLGVKPAPGWRFKRWSGGCTHTRPTCTLPMSAASSARATFVKR